MDDHSRCIGLITASDIRCYEQEHAGESATDNDTADFFDPDTEQWETIPLSAVGLKKSDDVRVSEVMSQDLNWVDR
jgi:hypothetical protein